MAETSQPMIRAGQFFFIYFLSFRFCLQQRVGSCPWEVDENLIKRHLPLQFLNPPTPLRLGTGAGQVSRKAVAVLGGGWHWLVGDQGPRNSVVPAGLTSVRC